MRAINDSNIISKTDVRWIITYANKEFCKISGYTKKELIWKPHSIVRHPDTPKEVFRELWNTLQNKQVWRWVVKNMKKDGNPYWVKAIITPLLDENNEIVEYISVRTDITELELTKQKLKLSLEKQQELNIKKDEILNIATHELRTPLTAIKWYISMVLGGDFGDITQELNSPLSITYESIGRLISLINNMLDISKIESWKEELIMSDTHIDLLIQEVVSETKWLFETKKQHLIISNNLQNFVYFTTKDKLKQVLFNLLWNAHKFTQEWWSIELDLKKTEKSLSISIQDNGLWIEKAFQKKIFEKFSQVKNSKTKGITGTWLWLPIVKTIIEQLGWTITVKSTLWKGSKFTICLPIK